MLRLQEDTVQPPLNLQLSSSKHQNEFSVGNNCSINESNNNNAIPKKNAALVTNNLLTDNNSGVKKKFFKPVENVIYPVSNLNFSISQVSDLNNPTPPLSSRAPMGSDNGNANNNCNVNNSIVNSNSNSNNYSSSGNDNNNSSNHILASNNGITTSTTSSPGVGNWTLSPQRDVSPPALMSGETVYTNSATLSYMNSNINSNTNSMAYTPHALVTDKELLSRTISNTTTMTSLTISNPAIINNNSTTSSTGFVNNLSSYEHTHVQQRPIFDKKLEIMESMQQQSSLANELRLIYHGLIGGHSVNLMINNVLAINIKLSDDESFKENHHDKNVSISNEERDVNPLSIEGGSRNSSGHLTMLTIADKDELLELLNSIKNNASSNSSSHSTLSNSFSTVQNLNENFKKLSNISPIEHAFKSQENNVRTKLNVNKSNLSEKLSSTENSYGNNSLNIRGVGGFQNRLAIHPDLQELIEAFDPTLPIEELSFILEIPLSEVQFCNLRDLMSLVENFDHLFEIFHSNFSLLLIESNFSIEVDIILHRITSHYIISHHIISHHIRITSYHITSHHIISNRIIFGSHHITSYHIRIISHHIISHHIISYPITSHHIIFVSHHIISHHIISYHI